VVVVKGRGDAGQWEEEKASMLFKPGGWRVWQKSMLPAGGSEVIEE
jgi:hypothetical protein